MNIAFNISPLKNLNKYRGVGIYATHLFTELKKNPNINIQEFENLSEVSKVDIVHYPYFDLFKHTLFLPKTIPSVVTIHDIIPLLFPNNYPPGIKGKINLFRQKRALKKTVAIITDSEASKKDIIVYLQVPEEKIFVIPLAPSECFKKISDVTELKQTLNKFNLPKEFALFVGDINYNKNLLNMAEAAIEANIDLVLIGKGFENKTNLNHPEMQIYKEFLKKYSNNSRIHILGFIGEKEIIEIINLATVLLLPSLAEGFGLSILEAQSCGIPVITSNISSMPKVAGKGALLVDPYSVESISQAINRINKNQELRQSLIEDGFENIKKYSWEKCTKGTLEVYQKAISGFRIRK